MTQAKWAALGLFIFVAMFGMHLWGLSRGYENGYRKGRVDTSEDLNRTYEQMKTIGFCEWAKEGCK
jgi:hypothetical protein